MSAVKTFLTRKNGRDGKLHITDILTYTYLIVGTFVMFGPVLWLVLSSFKSSGEINTFPPRLLPYTQETVVVDGYDEPLPLYRTTLDDGRVVELAQRRRIGLESQLIDPANPDEVIKVRIENREPVESVKFSLDNFREGIEQPNFKFWTFLKNSVLVTVVATILTLFINSMAAFALSKYKFTGRDFIFLIMISTLMIPVSVVLVPIYTVILKVGWFDSLWGIIIPGAATPTGVFLLRQYMLTIPDELLDSARMDGASEWRIYSQIILPLAKPALAVLAIFSVMWRWNDFLWPFVALKSSDNFTLQVGLQTFQSDLTIQWHLILAMTVLTLLPITIVFAVLQKYITTGIATTGMK